MPRVPCGQPRCRVAATHVENNEDQGGRTGTSAPHKPAWSLQEREMVDDLGLRGSGSIPPVSTRSSVTWRRFFDSLPILCTRRPGAARFPGRPLARDGRSASSSRSSRDRVAPGPRSSSRPASRDAKRTNASGSASQSREVLLACMHATTDGSCCSSTHRATRSVRTRATSSVVRRRAIEPATIPSNQTG